MNYTWKGNKSVNKTGESYEIRGSLEAALSVGSHLLPVALLDSAALAWPVVSDVLSGSAAVGLKLGDAQLR